eukprot:scaffold45609_cov214-Amphora_coffeaeformis.AAC.1
MRYSRNHYDHHNNKSRSALALLLLLYGSIPSSVLGWLSTVGRGRLLTETIVTNPSRRHHSPLPLLMGAMPRHGRSTTTTQLAMAEEESSSSHYYDPNQDDLQRSIECATTTGLCPDDELIRLAELLESYDECLGSSSDADDDCEQERVDRQDVADILRADAALQLRLVYLNNANAFKERVEELVAQSDGNNNNPVLETMARAVACASKPGLSTDSAELDRLAEALESYEGESLISRMQQREVVNEQDDEQEIVDRQDVADILRMQSSLVLRQVYLQNVNLFKERVDALVTTDQAIDANVQEDVS